MTMKLGFAVGLMGAPGILSLVVFGAPMFAAHAPDLVPVSTVRAALAVQTTLLVALAAWSGAYLAPRVGLTAPVVTACLSGSPVRPVLERQLLPGCLGGIAGAVVLWCAAYAAPTPVMELQQRFAPPGVVRVLYGGVTEEVLVRWGLMSVLLWGGWRVRQRGIGTPGPAIVWAAIISSALVFGAAHLPLLWALTDSPSVGSVGYLVGANAVFGVIAGWLYWRYGLECAVSAHVSAHVIVLTLF